MSLDLLEKESKIKLITHDVLEAKSDPFSIDFIPTNLEESVTFQDFLVDKCIMRDINCAEKTREEMREVLKNSVEHESQLKKISLRLEQCTPDEGMCFVLLQWIPCILHMENRVGLKILTMLLSKGLALDCPNLLLFGRTIFFTHQINTRISRKK